MMDSDETIITLLKKNYSKIKKKYNIPVIKNLMHIFGIGAFFLAIGIFPISKKKGLLLVFLSIAILMYRFLYFDGIFAGDKFLLDVCIIVPLLFILGIKRDSIEHLKHLSTIIGIIYILYHGKELVLKA